MQFHKISQVTDLSPNSQQANTLEHSPIIQCSKTELLICLLCVHVPEYFMTAFT
jgi:hypothetical protein